MSETNFFEQCYDEYKLFLIFDNDLLPSQINPIVQEEKDWITDGKSLAHVRTDDIVFHITNIFINEKLLKYNNIYQKSIMFHEFTHILDFLTISKKYSFDLTTSILSTYSEYHASQIEMLCLLHFKNIKTFKKMDLRKTYIKIKDESISLEDCYIDPLASAVNIIEKPPTYFQELTGVDYFRYYKIFEVNTMYYLGKRKLCEKISLSKIPNITNQSFNDFAPYIKAIENNIEKEDFDALLVSRNNLWTFFKSSFPCKNNYILPIDINKVLAAERDKFQCPFCNSSDINKKFFNPKSLKVKIYRIFHKVNNPWHCNNCGSDF